MASSKTYIQVMKQGGPTSKRRAWLLFSHSIVQAHQIIVRTREGAKIQKNSYGTKQSNVSGDRHSPSTNALEYTDLQKARER